MGDLFFSFGLMPKNSCVHVMKHANERFFKTQGIRHEMSKTVVLVTPYKGLMSSKNFKEINQIYLL